MCISITYIYIYMCTGWFVCCFVIVVVSLVSVCFGVFIVLMSGLNQFIAFSARLGRLTSPMGITTCRNTKARGGERKKGSLKFRSPSVPA